jgi:hypothetical protein
MPYPEILALSKADTYKAVEDPGFVDIHAPDTTRKVQSATSIVYSLLQYLVQLPRSRLRIESMLVGKLVHHKNGNVQERGEHVLESRTHQPIKALQYKMMCCA